jgi:6-phosphogluconolactonase
MSLLRNCILMALMAIPAAGADQLVFVGTYNGPQSKGIYAWKFNDATGALVPLGLAAESSQPSFLALHPTGKYLYSVNETGGKEGQVSAFSIDRASGRLTLLNTASAKGSGPCHLVVDHEGAHVLVANYGSGSVAVIGIGPDGKLGAATSFIQHAGSGGDPRRQKGPHAHSVNLSADARYVLSADLGLDKVLIYRYDAARGTLTPNDPPFAKLSPASGPRHIALHPGGKFAWVINEMNSTVTSFSWDGAQGVLAEIESVSTLPKGFSGESSTAEIYVHKSGRFLYGSNRGHDSIAVFSIDRGTGRLTLVQHEPTQGQVPRNFEIDPSGKWMFVANQKTGSVVIFKIDQQTGRLSPAGSSFQVGSPVSVAFLPLN